MRMRVPSCAVAYFLLLAALLKRRTQAADALVDSEAVLDDVVDVRRYQISALAVLSIQLPLYLSM